MPSPFARVSIVVSQEQHHILMRLATLQGRSQASYVRRVLDIATPALAALLVPLEAADEAEGEFDHDAHYALMQELREEDENLAQLRFEDFEDLEERDDPPRAANDVGAPAATPRSEDETATIAKPAHPYSNTGVRDPLPDGGDKRNRGGGKPLSV